MYRINTATKAIDLFGADKHGFRSGAPGGQSATQMSAPWHNDVQEELAAVVELLGGDALDPDDPHQVAKLLSSGLPGYWADTGAANAYAVAPSPAIAAYGAGQKFRWKAGAANTGAATLAVSGLAAKAITRRDGTALKYGDIPAGAICEAVYDGAAFQLLSAGRATLVKATWGVTQSIPNNVLTDVKPSSASFANMAASSYNASTGDITIGAADAGDYLMALDINLLAAAAYGIFTGWFINGSATLFLTGMNSASLPQGLGGSAIGVRSLAAGDVVRAKAHQNSGGSLSMDFAGSLQLIGK